MVTLSFKKNLSPTYNLTTSQQLVWLIDWQGWGILKRIRGMRYIPWSILHPPSLPPSSSIAFVLLEQSFEKKRALRGDHTPLRIPTPYIQWTVHTITLGRRFHHCPYLSASMNNLSTTQKYFGVVMCMECGKLYMKIKEQYLNIVRDDQPMHFVIGITKLIFNFRHSASCWMCVLVQGCPAVVSFVAFIISVWTWNKI